MEIFHYMNYQSEIVTLHDTFIDEMIDSCYTVDKYVIVRNTGRCWAKLHYRKYTYQNYQGVFHAKKNVKQLKKIFHGLINKYNSFEYDGYTYYYHRGEWVRNKVNTPFRK